MAKLKKDLVASICLIAYGVLYFAFSFQIPLTSVKTVSARFLPQIVAGGIIGLSLVLIYQTLTKMKKLKAETVGTEEAPEKKAEKKQIGRIQARQTYIEIVLLCVTAFFLMDKLGFILAMIFFLLMSFLTINERKNWNIKFYVFLSVLVPFALYFIFLKAFSVILPGGLLSFLL